VNVVNGGDSAFTRQHQFNFVRLSWSISSNFGENSGLKCASQPKIAKKFHWRSATSRFQCRSRTSMLVLPESSSAVLVMTSSKSVSNYNLSHVRLVDSSRNSAFWRKVLYTQIWCARTETPWT